LLLADVGVIVTLNPVTSTNEPADDVVVDVVEVAVTT
jgi:hypothetical protein